MSAIREFANVREMKFWCDNNISKNGPVACAMRILEPGRPDLAATARRNLLVKKKLPSMVPSFLGDLKRDNFGRIDGKLVCVDYAITIMNPDKN